MCPKCFRFGTYFRLFRLTDSVESWDQLQERVLPLLNMGIRALNRQQSSVVSLVSTSLGRVKNGLDAFRILVQGKAGTGKSFLIRVACLLAKTLCNDQESCPVIRCAPTGVAACVINGDTIHRWFSIPPGKHDGDYVDSISAEKRAQLRTRLSKARLLIVDEISMVGQTRWAQMDSALRYAFNNSDPFGGLTCLFTGDFSQIPPVGDPSITHQIQLLDGFMIVELTEGMRQREDPQFQDALNNFAEGCCSQEDLDLLRGRLWVVYDGRLVSFLCQDWKILRGWIGGILAPISLQSIT